MRAPSKYKTNKVITNLAGPFFLETFISLGTSEYLTALETWKVLTNI